MSTQNKQIKVSKDTVIKSFTNEVEVDYIPSSTLQKYDINALANQYRTPYPPVFADDSWYLPTSDSTAQTQAQPIVSEPTAMATDSVTIATAPIAQSIAQTITNVTSGQPITNQQKDDIGKALLIALGIFVLIKIVS